MAGFVRLDKFLADAGAGTRSEVKKMIQKGQVQINGTVVRRPEQKVQAETDTVMLAGEIIQAAEEFVYFLLHKPAGCVSATEDAREKTVMEYVPSARKGLFPVGRLDKDTEGLLLITSDGALAHDLLSPAKHVDKTYFARVKGRLLPEYCELFGKGLDIGDGKPTLPAVLTILSADEESEAEITIREGRFHQVKRMFAAVGCEVIYLKRLSMGGVILDASLPAGAYRPLTAEELTRIYGS